MEPIFKRDEIMEPLFIYAFRVELKLESHSSSEPSKTFSNSCGALHSKQNDPALELAF